MFYYRALDYCRASYRTGKSLVVRYDIMDPKYAIEVFDYQYVHYKLMCLTSMSLIIKTTKFCWCTINIPMWIQSLVVYAHVVNIAQSIENILIMLVIICRRGQLLYNYFLSAFICNCNLQYYMQDPMDSN